MINTINYKEDEIKALFAAFDEKTMYITNKITCTLHNNLPTNIVVYTDSFVATIFPYAGCEFG